MNITFSNFPSDFKGSGFCLRDTNIVSVDASCFGNLQYATNMFNGCYYLQEIKNPHFENVLYANSMFAGCSRLSQQSINNCLFTMDKVESAQYMFANGTNCRYIPKKLNGDLCLPNVKDISGMFYYNSKIEYIDCKIPSATNITNLFSDCKNLKGFIDENGTITNLYFPNATNANGMFYKCGSLGMSPYQDGSKLVIDMSQSFPILKTANNMFNGCVFLTDDNLIVNCTQIKEATGMFYGFGGMSAKSNIILDTTTFGNISGNCNMFGYCEFTSSDDFFLPDNPTKVFTGKVYTKIHQFINFGFDIKKINSLVLPDSLSSIQVLPKVVINDIYDGTDYSQDDKIKFIHETLNRPDISYNVNISYSNFIRTSLSNYPMLTKQPFNLDTLDVQLIDVNLDDMANLVSIINNGDTNVNLSFESIPDDFVNATSFFAGVTKLRRLDCSKFDRVVNATRMFEGCTDVTVYSPNFSSLEIADYMFYGFVNQNEKSINCSSFNKVTSAISMFENCSNLDIITPNFSSLKTATRMFKNAFTVTEKDISCITFTNVENAEEMFYRCHLLVSIEHNFRNLKNSKRMFEGCNRLGKYTNEFFIRNFENLTVSSDMFYSCNALTVVITSECLKKLVDGSRMFSDCKQVIIEEATFNSLVTAEGMFSNTAVTITGTPFVKVANANSMFRGSSIESVDLGYISSITDANNMFRDCPAIKEVYGWNIDRNVPHDNIFKDSNQNVRIHIKAPEPREIDFSLVKVTTREDKKFIKRVLLKNNSTQDYDVDSAVGDSITFYKKNDEIAVGNIPDEDFGKMAQYRYEWNNTGCLDPSKKNFVIWADEDSNVVSNVLGAGGGGLEVTEDSEDLDIEDSFISMEQGVKVSKAKSHPLKKLFNLILDKLKFADISAITLVLNPFERQNWSEGLRINRAKNNWSTLTLGGASGSTEGTDETIWSLHATPLDHETNPNELTVCRNGSAGTTVASFFKDRYGRIGFKTGGSIISKENGFSPIAQSFKPENNENNGYVQLRFPDIWHYNMLSFKVRIAECGGRLIEVLCYGYTYGDGRWYNTTASTVGSNTTARIRVWFGAGSDGTATVLFCWEDRQIEGYVQVDVFDFSCGYSNRHYDVSQIEIAITPSINWTRGDASHYVTNALRNNAMSSAVENRGFGNGEFTWYQTYEWFEGENGWASYLISNHGDGASYYNQTIRMPFWDAPQYYRKQGGANTPWYTFITTENMGSYIPAKPVEITPLSSIYTYSSIYNYKSFKEELGSVKRFTLFFGLKAGSNYCDTSMREYIFSMPKSEFARVFGVNADDYRSVLPKFRVDVSTLLPGYNNGNTLINIAGGKFYAGFNSQTGAVESYSLSIYYKSFSYNGSFGSETVGDSDNNMVFKVVVTLDL